VTAAAAGAGGRPAPVEEPEHGPAMLANAGDTR
jgi:hypothetical protein